MECELPCEESLFQAQHPFSQPNFQFSRGITIYKAFQSLFEPIKQDSLGPSAVVSQMRLTVLDTFILIHGMISIVYRKISQLTDPRSSIHIHQYTYDIGWIGEKAKLGHAIFTKSETAR